MSQRPPSGEGGAVGPLWRIAIFILACSVGVLGLRVLMSPLSEWIESISGVRLPSFVLTLSGGMLIGHWWTFRVVESRRWRSVSLDRSAFTLRKVATGAALGAAAVGLPSALLLGIGWLRLEPMPPGNLWTGALMSLALLLPAALWEELLTRGYLFAVVRDRFGARIAIVATAILFGVMHLENAGATLQSVTLVTVAGIFLGTILVSLQSLYAAWAAHVAWNFVMAGVMHTSVSGIGMGTPNYRTVDAGPDWATGGVWGPEAGVFAGVGMALAVFFLLRRGTRHGARSDDG
ncbi:MAG: type II CAAX endopeptidase family protein [Gemmatimonadaceae bacterium]